MNSNKGGLLELGELGTYRVDKDGALFVIKEKFKALSEVDVFYLNLLRTIDFEFYNVIGGNYNFKSLVYSLLEFRKQTLEGEEIYIARIGDKSSLEVDFVFKPYPILGNLIKVLTPPDTVLNMEAYEKIVGKEFIDYESNTYIDSFDGSQIINIWADSIEAMLK
jgi:hypothetical protein